MCAKMRLLFSIQYMNRKTEGGSPEREQATEIEVPGEASLEEAVNQLIGHRERGESVFCTFNGHKLYSADVTLDSAFLEVTGKNKADADREQKEWLENYQRETEAAVQRVLAKIPKWIKMGKKLGIDPSLLDDWEKMVRIRASDIYQGIELDAAIAVMQKINDGASAKEIKDMLHDQGHSGGSYSEVRSIIEEFSTRGKDIFRGIAKLENN